MIEGLKVTNDVTEKDVKLIQDFSTSVTAQEEHPQQLPQVVEKHWKEVTDFSKSSLARLK